MIRCLHSAFLLALLVVVGGMDAAMAQSFLPVSLRDVLIDAEKVTHKVSTKWQGMVPNKGKVIVLTPDNAYVLEGKPDVNKLPIGLYDKKLDAWVLPVVASSFSGSSYVTWCHPGEAPTTIMPFDESKVQQKAIWSFTYAHEIFHQWQMSQPGYFPAYNTLTFSPDEFDIWSDISSPLFEDVFLRDKIVEMARILSSGNKNFASLLPVWESLENQLSSAKLDFIRLQLWQEGIAKFVEYEAIIAVLNERNDFSPQFVRQTSHYKTDLDARLATLISGKVDASSMYLMGILMGSALEKTGNDWRNNYIYEPFEIKSLLEYLIRCSTID